MPDYADLLDFLAKNPPQMESERQLHASLLELMAQCLRNEAPREQTVNNGEWLLEGRTIDNHAHWAQCN